MNEGKTDARASLPPRVGYLFGFAHWGIGRGRQGIMAMGGADTENRGVGKPEGKRGTNETKGIDGKMFWESIDGM